MIKKKEWDSDFFNLNVGELDFKECNDSLNYLDYDLLYVMSSEDFDLSLKGFENSFSEEKVKFHKELKVTKQLSENVFSYRETTYNIQDIYQLAYESGSHSRFLLDKKFSSEKFRELYRLWIDNSISGQFADDVLLYKEQGQTIGLLTYKTKEEDAFVGLIAVSSNHQGKGIGGIMLRHLETVLYTKGIESLSIPTQRQNEQACHFYAKQGYSISENIHIKHYWKIYDTI
ncbi:GNAT family N-acetyltransferase [Flavobacterium sp. AS60]|uniref:GNAT family N-acetyltransferase n=1 Tax=Flavobacterium anseongense TaxID=2910677 RepID=UPI001F4756B2|nr:GNAT family N-acetyltransferase [Flavobacterium sp. AS60]MCF6129784.1 GNAT family N-acetyltransferase [Flavobacterium sp. AS60]